VIYGRNLEGEKHGHLTVIEKVGTNVICKCDCGNKITIRAVDFARGKYSTCGCSLRYKLMSESATKHGDTRKSSPYARIYRIYQGMKNRCYIKSFDGYDDYGGRGILVCDEWLKSYSSFRKWALNNGYADSLSIDRIDVNGNYSPDNCRWATTKEQSMNKRPYKRKEWTIDGVTKSIIEWCEECGLSVPMVMYRVKTKGMTPKDALTARKYTKRKERAK
jgi:hypothetical protein